MSKKMLCPCCMEYHEPQVCREQESNIFQGQVVSYAAEYSYCPAAEEYYATEEQMRRNDMAMKDAYRMSLGRLTSAQIAQIRARYQVSQVDFAKVLGLGEKTITRYETFQVQTEAYDGILRKVARDPEWYLELLDKAKGQLAGYAYEKSRQAALSAFAEMKDEYQRNALAAQQARYGEGGALHGFSALSTDKIVDVINYFASSPGVSNLYTVKLMKLMWYGDFLCFKRFRHSITGLAYEALPMGAVPVGYQNIIELNGVRYETERVADAWGNHFICDAGYAARNLSDEEIAVLDTVIQRFGSMSKNALVERMHKETAFKMTLERDVISYGHAERLSIG